MFNGYLNRVPSGAARATDGWSDGYWGAAEPVPKSPAAAVLPTPRKPQRRSYRAAVGALVACLALSGVLLHHRNPSSFPLLQHAAADGDENAQLLLGLAYRDGRQGVTPDPAKATYWLRRSAEGGNAYAEGLLRAKAPEDVSVVSKPASPNAGFAAHAQSFLGAVTRSRSIEGLQRAARSGDAQAQYQLGYRYQTGSWGVEQDAAKAVYWLRRAAENGDQAAARALAHLQTARSERSLQR